MTEEMRGVGDGDQVCAAPLINRESYLQRRTGYIISGRSEGVASSQTCFVHWLPHTCHNPKLLGETVTAGQMARLHTKHNSQRLSPHKS